MIGDTIDDIRARDVDNLEHVMRGRRMYWFYLYQHAERFRGRCLQATLERIGVPKAADGSSIDAMLAKNGIRIENRPFYWDEDDKWRQGLYVYKDNEIVAFIGQPYEQESQISRHAPPWRLWTTVEGVRAD